MPMFTAGDYAEFRGNPQMIARMKRQEALAKMTPEQRADLKRREAEAARASARAKGVINAFKHGGADIWLLPGNKPAKERVPTHYKETYEKLRALALDDANPDQWLEFNRVLPMREIRGLPIGKFRFNWDQRGNMVFVPWTRQSWENFFRHPQRGRWIPNQPFMYKCSPEWETHWIGKYFAESEKQRVYPRFSAPGDKRKVWQHTAGAAICKKPKKSLWVKIRKPLAIAAGIVAAVYLGPVVLDKIGAIAGGGSGAATGAGGAAAGTGTAAGTAAGTAGTAAGTATKASLFTKIKAGSTKLLGYVNKARTIEAIAKGELPPPPIGIAGSSFREWALIVAKEKIKDEAIEYAMETGQKYIAKKMSEKEEAKLRAEIEEMQRQLLALTPPEVKEMPPEPAPELAAPIKKIQAIEEKKQADLEQFIIPGAIVAGALLLGG